MTGVADEDCAMTSDRLELYFSSTRAGGPGQIYRSVRATVDDAWSAPVHEAALDGGDWDVTPEPASDGVTMWFTSNRLPVTGTDIFITTRATPADAWGAPLLVDSLYVPDTFEYGPSSSRGGLTMVFSSDRTGNYDLYVATRFATTDPWSAPAPIAELATSFEETDPFLTDDGLTLYFTSNVTGNRELVVATRTSVSEPFVAPVPLDELNSAFDEQDIWLSPDGHHVIFASNRTGDYDVYEAER